MSSKKQKLLMILGMHRSGTSAVGKLMQCVGFEFGNNLLEGMQSINEEGFWEDRDVVALNQHIFGLYGFDWFDFERLPGKWWEEDRIKDLVGIAETWYLESFDNEKPVAVKDPRFCRLLPFWKRAFAGLDLDVRVLFVFRHPAEVAASLKRRDGFPLELGYLLWLSYAIDALYYSRNMELLLLHYNRLVEKDADSIKCLREFISAFGTSAQNFDACIEQSIDASQKNQTYTPDENSSGGDIKAMALELYEELTRSDSEMAKNIADKYRKRLYRLMDHHFEILGAMQDGIRHRVNETQKMFKLGEEHAHALSVIREKDTQLEENRNFIERCLQEIKNKDQLLEQSSAPSSERLEVESYARKFDGWMEDIKRLIDDYRSQIAEQKQYIEECESKIAEQDKGLADNQDYIARCHARIAEQDAGIAENKGYIVACEERIRVQDEGLVLRDRSIEEKTEKIVELEKSFTTAQEQLLSERLTIEQLKNRSEHLARELQECEGAKSNMEADLLKARQQIDDLQSVLGEKEARLTESSDRIIHLQHVVGEHQEKLRALDESLQLKQAEVEESFFRISSQSEQIVLIQRDLNDLTEKLDSASKERDVLCLKLDEQERQLRELMQKLHFSEGAAETLRLKAMDQDDTLKMQSRMLGERMAELELVRQDLANAALKLDEKTTEVEARNGEIDRLKGLDHINHRRLSLQKVQIEKLKAHAAALESEMVALRARQDESLLQLQRYRGYTIVRVLDKIFPEKS